MSERHLEQKMLDLYRASKHMSEQHADRLNVIFLEKVIRTLHQSAKTDDEQYLIEGTIHLLLKDLGYIDRYGYYQEPRES